jgi:hypothetical protein
MIYHLQHQQHFPKRHGERMRTIVAAQHSGTRVVSAQLQSALPAGSVEDMNVASMPVIF